MQARRIRNKKERLSLENKKVLCYNELDMAVPDRNGKPLIKTGGVFMAILSEFLIEAVRAIFLMAVIVGAVFTGKKLREQKDAKNANTQ